MGAADVLTTQAPTMASSLRTASTLEGALSDGPEFDCTAGFDVWRIGWSRDKKRWCCSHEGKACPFDCKAGVPRWRTGWSEEKKHWCFSRSLAFDCEADLKNWKSSWS